jgi:hypothetical protein
MSPSAKKRKGILGSGEQPSADQSDTPNKPERTRLYFASTAAAYLVQSKRRFSLSSAVAVCFGRDRKDQRKIISSFLNGQIVARGGFCRIFF